MAEQDTLGGFSGAEVTQKGVPRGWNPDAQDQQAKRDQKIGDLLDAYVHHAWSWDVRKTVGLDYHYIGGCLKDEDGDWGQVAASSVALNDNQTNYVERDEFGMVTVSLAGFDSSLIPMAIVETQAGIIKIRGYEDCRPMGAGGSGGSGEGGEGLGTGLARKIVEGTTQIASVQLGGENTLTQQIPVPGAVVGDYLVLKTPAFPQEKLMYLVSMDAAGIARLRIYNPNDDGSETIKAGNYSVTAFRFDGEAGGGDSGETALVEFLNDIGDVIAPTPDIDDGIFWDGVNWTSRPAPVPTLLTGSGTPDFLTKWAGATDLGDSAFSQVGGQMLAPFANAALPAYSYAGRPGDGMFSDGDGSLGFSVNGAGRAVLQPSGFHPYVNEQGDLGQVSRRWGTIYANLIVADNVSIPGTQPDFPIIAPNGLASAPSYSFAGPPTKGMYAEDADSVDFSVTSARRLSISALGVTSYVAQNSFGSAWESVLTTANDQFQIGDFSGSVGIIFKTGIGTGGSIAIAETDASTFQSRLLLNPTDILLQVRNSGGTTETLLTLSSSESANAATFAVPTVINNTGIADTALTLQRDGAVFQFFTRTDLVDLSWAFQIDGNGEFELRSKDDAGVTVNTIFQTEHATGITRFGFPIQGAKDSTFELTGDDVNSFALQHTGEVNNPGFFFRASESGNHVTMEATAAGADLTTFRFRVDGSRFILLNGTTQEVQFYTTNVLRYRMTDTAIYPQLDGTYDIGTTGNRWKSLFADRAEITDILWRGVGGAFAPVIFNGSFLSDGTGSSARGMQLDVDVTADVLDTGSLAQLQLAGSFTTPGGAASPFIDVATLRINEPDITLGVGDTITNAATVIIRAAPTEGVNNSALWVESGLAKFDGTINVSYGSEALPGIAFTGVRSDDGFYSVGSGQIGVSVFGVHAYTFTSSAIQVASGTSKNLGTAGNPWDTLYVNNIVGGAPASFPLTAPDGSAGAPSYSFADETTMGIYRSPTGPAMNFRSNGGRFSFSSDGNGWEDNTATGIDQFQIGSYAQHQAGILMKTNAEAIFAWASSSAAIDGRIIGNATKLSFSFGGGLEQILMENDTLSSTIPLLPSVTASVSLGSTSFRWDLIWAGKGEFSRSTGAEMIRMTDSGASGVAANPHLAFYDSLDTRLGVLGHNSTSNSDMQVLANISGASVQIGGSNAFQFTVSAASLVATVPFYADNGSAAVPGIAFTGSTSDGFYRIGVNRLGITIGGLFFGEFRTDTSARLRLQTGYSFAAGNDTLGKPGFTWENDLDTGMYEHAGDQIGFIGGGALGCIIGGTFVALPAGNRLYLDGGSNTYIAELVPDQISLVSASSSVMELNGSNILAYKTFRGLGGSQGTPGYTFTADTNTGMYLSSSDILGFATGGAQRLLIHSTFLQPTVVIRNANGTAALPAYAFSSDPNTGIYRDGAVADRAWLAAGGISVLGWGESGGAAVLGFYGTVPGGKPTVTGSRAGNAALTDLLAELAVLGLITNSTSS